MVRQKNRCLPIETVRIFAQFMFWLNVCCLVFFTIDSEIVSKLKSRVYNIGISTVYLHLHSVATHNAFPWVLATCMPSYVLAGIICSYPNTVILQSAINVIWFVIIDVDCIKLPNGRRIVLYPILTIIVSYVDTTIITIN